DLRYAGDIAPVPFEAEFEVLVGIVMTCVDGEPGHESPPCRRCRQRRRQRSRRVNRDLRVRQGLAAVLEALDLALMLLRRGAAGESAEVPALSVIALLAGIEAVFARF